MKKQLVVFIVIVVLALAAGLGIQYYQGNRTVTLGGYHGEPVEKIGHDSMIKQLPPELLAMRKNQLAELSAKLSENPNQAEVWMNVGLVKKFFNNYQGAVQAYEYAAVLRPMDPLIHYNLGNLYGAYLKDYSKAEAEFIQARDFGLSLPYTHLALAGFYHDFYKDKISQVEPVLLEGLRNIPNDANMMLNLALYYKEIGQKIQAITYFRKLLNHEDVSGLQKQQIEAEIKALNK